mmetsp:Transcript_204/g.315  ORF Transcript_204/g.315 Transcript_204/m.315 type:complete len:242 (-) Transcript_204:171-896(-)
MNGSCFVGLSHGYFASFFRSEVVFAPSETSSMSLFISKIMFRSMCIWGFRLSCDALCKIALKHPASTSFDITSQSTSLRRGLHIRTTSCVAFDTLTPVSVWNLRGSFGGKGPNSAETSNVDLALRYLVGNRSLASFSTFGVSVFASNVSQSSPICIVSEVLSLLLSSNRLITSWSATCGLNISQSCLSLVWEDSRPRPSLLSFIPKYGLIAALRLGMRLVDMVRRVVKTLSDCEGLAHAAS